MPAQSVRVTEVVSFGEVLYDVFPNGKRVLGGAPFNVAWGLKGFGHDPLLLSAVGADLLGRQVRDGMSDWQLSVEGLQVDPSLATGEVYVTIENDEPSYEIGTPRAWDSIQVTGVVARRIIYHGSLATRSAVSEASLRALIECSPATRFFDVNLRAPYYEMKSLRQWMRGANWLKLNIDELAIVLGDRSVTFQNGDKYVERLIDDFEIENVLLTGGAQGALIQGACGYARCSPAPTPQPFVDAVGAGDLFTAYTIHGILSNMSVEQIVTSASAFAAKVCGVPGATSGRKSFYMNLDS